MDSVVTGVQLANSINELINRKTLNSSQLAKVVGTNPIKIQLQTGLVLDRSDVLISKQLLQYEISATFTTSNPNITASSTANTNINLTINNSVTDELKDIDDNKYKHKHTVTSSPNITANTTVNTNINQQSSTQQNTTIKIEQLLKTGDIVLVTVIGDNYVVTDIVE